MTTEKEVDDAAVVVEENVVEFKEQIETKVAEVKEVADAKVAEVQEQVEVAKIQIEEKKAEVVAQVTDYKAMIDKYLKMDTSAIKTNLANLDTEMLNGLGGKLGELITEQTDAIASLEEKVKGMSMASLMNGDAKVLNDQVTHLINSKKEFSALYDQVMAQVKSYTK